MNDKVAVFGQRRGGVYLLSQLYNPDDINSSVQNVGKVIPAVGSIIVDDSIGNHNRLYVVYSVDAITFKSTLVPASLAELSDTGDDQIVTYGNNVYMVYYDKQVIGGKYYWELVVDNKISIFGERAAKYSLYKGSSLVETMGVDSVISNGYLDEYGNIIKPEGNLIPMAEIIVPVTTVGGETTSANARIPIVCYSESEIESGETILFVAYDKDNRIIAQISMVAHETLGLSQLAKKQWPVERFEISANQLDSEDGYCYLYRGQSVDELHFYADIIYANGDMLESARIDNTQLFIYGVENIDTAVVGSTYTVLFKYFLDNNEYSLPDKNYHIGDSGRYITTEIKVKIVNAVSTNISKAALMVAYDSQNHYRVFPVLYYKNFQTPQVCANEDYLASDFDGSRYLHAQAVKFKTYETSEGEEPLVYYKTYQLNLFNPDITTSHVFYYFRDEPRVAEDLYYGKNYTNAPRPYIHYSTVDYKFTIPGTIFETVDMFLNSFYYNACPPKDTRGTIPEVVTPTHFQIRKLDIDNKDISLLTLTPIPIADYYKPLQLTDSSVITPGSSVFVTCIVEFLRKNDNGGYDHIYGVPVDVIPFDEGSVDPTPPEPQPSGKVVIPTEQVNTGTQQEPPYKYLIGEWSGRNLDTEIYVSGHADDCLEIAACDPYNPGIETVLFSDVEGSAPGEQHDYSDNQPLCVVPRNTPIKIYAWDTAYSVLRWEGEVYYYNE